MEIEMSLKAKKTKGIVELDQDDIIHLGRRKETKGIAHKTIKDMKRLGSDGAKVGTNNDNSLGVKHDKGR